ncbi:hypothetical protein S245_020222, partial [Arachis hypogaea]
MVEECNLDHISLAILSYIHNQVSLWNITWNGASFVHGRPQKPFTEVFIGRTRRIGSSSHHQFLTLVKVSTTVCYKKWALHFIRDGKKCFWLQTVQRKEW